MSIKETSRLMNSRQWPTSTKYAMFLDMFADLPTRSMARKLVESFDEKHIRELIAELEKNLARETVKQ
jgi:hypothetical protein